MTIINFDDIIGKKFKTITSNVFCLNHPSNCLVIGKANSGKINVVMNLIAKNCIYEKIYIYSNNIDDKYNWLQNKFKNDVFIYLNEIDFDKIDKRYVNLIIFDDLVFSNKKISEFYCKSRKLSCTSIFIGHRYFNPLTAVGTLGTKFSKPHYYFDIGPFLNPINYFATKKLNYFLVKKF